MGKFSKSIETGASKQEAGKAQAQKQTVQLKDNRSENFLQLKLIEIANSKMANESIQREAMEEEELQLKGIEEEELQMKGIDEEELQLKGMEEEDLQMKGMEEEELQMKGMEGEEIQMKLLESGSKNHILQNFLVDPVQRVENNTGLPDQLKSGVENLSGYSLNDVKVHYNSDKPAQLNAHAFAQGTEIHLASGQEKHLPHEAWHVVQQKQGRVRPTRQLKGKVNVNDDAGLEKEADIMGSKALLQKKSMSKKDRQTATSSVIQKKTDDVTDSRMNDLVKRVLSILEVLMVQGQNWEAIYGEKGSELGKSGVEKAKNAIVGGDKKKGPSLKEKLIKEALKRWFATMDTQEKAGVLLEISGKSGNVISGFFSGISDLISGNKDEETEEVRKEKEGAQNNEFTGFISKLNLDDIQTFYDTYKKYKIISNKVKEFESKTTELAKELGATVGAKVGEIKTEREFVSKFEEQKAPYKVAKLEFEFLKESIKNKESYKDELDALSDALDSRLQGPNAMINNPEIFSEKAQMAKATEACSIAYDNLKIANILRNGTASLFPNISNLISEGIEGVFGKSSEKKEKIDLKQRELVLKIKEVCNKSWYKFTSGIFVLKPNGVTEVGDKLQGSGNYAEKLNTIKENLTQPEIELANTEKEISKVDSDLSSSAKALKSDLTIDNVLSETRSQKSTEKYGGKQIGNSSKLADRAVEKGKLELKKSDLNKKIKGKNRHPLTQVFYNAIKGIDPNNLLSLEKSIAIFTQIEKELDSPKHTA